MSRSAVPSAALALAVALAACGGKQLTRDLSSYGAPTAEQAVRSFLDAAQADQYPRMARLFGTRDGPAEARLGVTNVEQRMVVLAGLMEHEDYRVESSRLTEPAPHRQRFSAQLRGTRQGDVSVPMFVVRSERGRWYVERVDTDPLTAGSP